MKTLFKILFALVGIVFVALPATLWFALFSDEPAVTFGEPVSSETVGELQNLLFTTQVGQFRATERQLNQAMQYGIQDFQKRDDVAAVLDLQQDEVTLNATLTSPLPLRPYLNVQLRLGAVGKDIDIRGVRLGSIPIPPPIAEQIWREAWRQAQQQANVQPIIDGYAMLDAIRITDRDVYVEYGNSSDTEQVKRRRTDLLLGKSITAILPVYQQTLQDHFGSLKGQRISLAAVMPTLWRLALQRSNDGHDPVAENKALILALALHVVPAKAIAAIGLDGPITHPGKPFLFTLEGQYDLGRHFLTTAAVTVFSNGRMAALVGLQKELEDSKGRSGFSVDDLIADHAGALFAQVATATDESARHFQRRMAGQYEESFFMPNTQTIGAEIEKVLVEQASRGDTISLNESIDEHIGQFVLRAPAYQ